MTVLRSQKILQEKNVSDANSVTKLTLTHKALSDVSCLIEFKVLERLDLGLNSLTSLEGLKLCVNLKWLSVVQNKLQSLNGIEGLTKLNVLNCGKNKLKSMDEVKFLVNLRALILNDNEISSICKLDQNKELNTLVLSRNPISSLGDSLIKLKSVTKLSLSNCRLQMIDSSLKFCTELKELRLAHNLIATLPNDFAHFTKLQNLDLGNNLITKWSTLKGLSSLVNLKNLNLQGNPIAEKENLVKKVRHLLPNLHIFNAKPTENPLGKGVANLTNETDYKSSFEDTKEFNQELKNKSTRKAHSANEVVDKLLEVEDSASKKKKKTKRPLDEKAAEEIPEQPRKTQRKERKINELEKPKAPFVEVDGVMKDKKSTKAVGGDDHLSTLDNPETPFADLFLTEVPDISKETVNKTSDLVSHTMKGKKSRKLMEGKDFKGTEKSVLFAACGPKIHSETTDKKLVHGTFKHLDESSGAVSVTVYKRKIPHAKADPTTPSQSEIGLGGASSWA